MKKEYDLKKLRKRRGKVKIDPGAAKVPVSSPSTRLFVSESAKLGDESELFKDPGG